MQIFEIEIAKLVFDPANARKHDTKNLDAIKGSLARFGQQKPIVIDQKNVVRAGNGTLRAAIDLGWDRLKVVRSELQGSEMVAFAIADNRSAELAEWNKDVLDASLLELFEEGFDIDSIGFDSKDFEIKEMDLPDLPDGDKGEFEQMAFKLHESQAEIVREAIAIALKEPGVSDDVNPNKNANALAYICGVFRDLQS